MTTLNTCDPKSNPVGSNRHTYTHKKERFKLYTVRVSIAFIYPYPLALAASRQASKLAIIMWSRHLARELNGSPSFIAVNPGSLLGTKMVREGFGIDGKSVSIGADILLKAATDGSFANANGSYFDNDSGAFASPHPHAMDDAACAQMVVAMDGLLKRITGR